VLRALPLFLLVACAGGAPEPSSSAIQGGVETGIAYSAVGWIRTPAGHCTASLVSPRVLLTAAHCVTDDTRASKIELFLGPRAETFAGCGVAVQPAAWIERGLTRTIDTSIHNDVAAIALDRAPPLPPGQAPLALSPSRSPWDPAVAPLPLSIAVMVGYGAATDGPAGVRRMALGLIQTDDGGVLTVGGAGSGLETITAGDSGGPLVRREGDREVVVGVASIGIDGIGFADSTRQRVIRRDPPLGVYAKAQPHRGLVDSVTAARPEPGVAGPVPSMACSGLVPRCTGLAIDDLTCSADVDCALVQADPCCGEALVAVASSRETRALEHVGACERPDPICAGCTLPPARAICAAGRCQAAGP
jgi:hypothetical protein